MSVRTQRWCVWCGPIFVALFAIGFWAVARFVPPPSPDLSAEQIAARYADNRNQIRAGLQIAVGASALFFPFVAAMSVQIKRIEGRESPLAYAQLAAGAGSTLVFVFPLMFMQAAAFRSDRSPGDVQALNDLAFIPFVGLFCVPMVQNVCLAIAILQDKRADPVFPRWSGYFNLWIGSCYLPAVMLVFFKEGPFAWNGLLPWWLGAAAFFSWVLVMAVLMLRAIDRNEDSIEIGSTPPSELQVAWVRFLHEQSEQGSRALPVPPERP